MIDTCFINYGQLLLGNRHCADILGHIIYYVFFQLKQVYRLTKTKKAQVILGKNESHQYNKTTVILDHSVHVVFVSTP